MALFRRIFMKGSREGTLNEDAPCKHIQFVPHWDNIHDMGHVEKVTYYLCDKCHIKLTPEEVDSLGRNPSRG